MYTNTHQYLSYMYYCISYHTQLNENQTCPFKILCILAYAYDHSTTLILYSRRTLRERLPHPVSIKYITVSPDVYLVPFLLVYLIYFYDINKKTLIHFFLFSRSL